jgi:hypothetical protein
MNSALIKFRHQLLAKASGMEKDLMAHKNDSCYRSQFMALLHSCALTRKMDFSE